MTTSAGTTVKGNLLMVANFEGVFKNVEPNNNRQTGNLEAWQDDALSDLVLKVCLVSFDPAIVIVFFRDIFRD